MTALMLILIIAIWRDVRLLFLETYARVDFAWRAGVCLIGCILCDVLIYRTLTP